MRLWNALVVALMLAASTAHAQQQPAPQPQPTEQQLFLNEALAVLQKQRNDAMDALTNAEARVGMLIKQNRALVERLKSVEDALAKREQQP